MLHAFGELHFFFLILTVIVIVYADHQAFLYFKGKKERLSQDFVAWSHRLVWTGLLMMIATGAALAVPEWGYLSYYLPFYIKMGFVLVLIINSFAIGYLSRHATEQPFAELSSSVKTTLFISGALSFTGWVGAAVIGLFFF